MQGDTARNLLFPARCGIADTHAECALPSVCTSACVTRAEHERLCQWDSFRAWHNKDQPKDPLPPPRPCLCGGSSRLSGTSPAPALLRSPVGKLRHGAAWRRG